MLRLKPCREIDLTDIADFVNSDSFAEKSDPGDREENTWELTRVFNHFDEMVLLFEHPENRIVWDDGEETANRYRLVVCESETGHVKRHNQIKLTNYFLGDIVRVQGSMVYVLFDGTETYIADDEMLINGDKFFTGTLFTDSDLLQNGRAVLSFYGRGDDCSLLILDKDDEGYTYIDWNESECITVHADIKDNIWVNLPYTTPRLGLFEQPDLDLTGRMAEDEEFDAFTLSDDESLLMVCHTRGDMPTELYVLINSENGYINPERLDLAGVEDIEELEFFRSTIICIKENFLYIYDINDLCTLAHGPHGGLCYNKSEGMDTAEMDSEN